MGNRGGALGRDAMPRLFCTAYTTGRVVFIQGAGGGVVSSIELV